MKTYYLITTDHGPSKQRRLTYYDKRLKCLFAADGSGVWGDGKTKASAMLPELFRSRKDASRAVEDTVEFALKHNERWTKDNYVIHRCRA